MIPALLGLPAKVKTLIDRLTATRAAALDNLNATVSSRAAAATALSNAVWTDALADALASAARRRPPLAAGLIARNYLSNSNSVAYWGIAGAATQNISGNTLVDVVNYSGAGVLLLLAAHNGASGPSSPQIIVTRDGVEEYNGTGPATTAYNVCNLVGAASLTGGLAGSGFALALQELEFTASLRIQAKAGATGSMTTAVVWMKTAP